jgi:hypothetical protein
LGRVSTGVQSGRRVVAASLTLAGLQADCAAS